MTHKVPLGYTENNWKYLSMGQWAILCYKQQHKHKMRITKANCSICATLRKKSYLHKVTYTHILCAFKNSQLTYYKKDCF